jgi:divalent metal cation (Fe/Co/Zn/Cd) transporter
VGSLVDVAPLGVAEQVKETVEALPGVIDCHAIRVRYSGPRLFLDIHVHMDGRQTLQQAHEISDRIEQRLHEVLADVDVTVHPEPNPAQDVKAPDSPR